MVRFALTRIGMVIPPFIGITLLAFFLIRLVPGDPIETMAGEPGLDAAPHDRPRQEYGFDHPVLGQYGRDVARIAPRELRPSNVSPHARAAQVPANLSH